MNISDTPARIVTHSFFLKILKHLLECIFVIPVKWISWPLADLFVLRKFKIKPVM